MPDRRILYTTALLVMMGAPAMGEDASEAPSEAAADSEPRPPQGPPWPDEMTPMEPGIHHLRYEWEYEGQTRRMTYALYLPETVKQAADGGRKLPLVLFLVGRGSRGHALAMALREGPLFAMRRSKAFAATMDYAVLVPQVPRNKRWESEEMGRFVADTTRRVLARWPIDPKRVCLTGKSMGGEGVYHAALAGPDLFSVVACISGRAHPDPPAVAAAMKEHGVCMFIAVGEQDGGFTSGSQKMAKAFDAAGVDVSHVVIPDRAHDVWMFYMIQPKFYEWMLKHRQGEPAPTDRATVEELVYFASKPPDERYQKFTEALQKQFEKFKPWWAVENCAMMPGVGHHKLRGSDDEVFVTYPLNRHTPCRIMYTAKVPEGKKTTLLLEVSNTLNGRWELAVNVESQRRLHTRVAGGGPGRGDWQTHRVDLTHHAGQKVFIEILHLPWHHGKIDTNATGYWRRIELVHEELPPPPPPDPVAPIDPTAPPRAADQTGESASRQTEAEAAPTEPAMR